MAASLAPPAGKITWASVCSPTAGWGTMVVGSRFRLLLELLLETGRLHGEQGILHFQPLTVIIVGYQLLNCRLQAAVFPYPLGFLLHVISLFRDIGCSPLAKVSHNMVLERVSAWAACLRQQEVKAGGIISNGLSEPLLPSKRHTPARAAASWCSSQFCLRMYKILAGLLSPSAPMERISCLARSSSVPRSQQQGPPWVEPGVTALFLGWNPQRHPHHQKTCLAWVASKCALFEAVVLLPSRLSHLHCCWPWSLVYCCPYYYRCLFIESCLLQMWWGGAAGDAGTQHCNQANEKPQQIVYSNKILFHGQNQPESNKHTQLVS